MNIKDIVRSYLEYLSDDANTAEARRNPVCFDLENGKFVKNSQGRRQSIIVGNQDTRTGILIGLESGTYHYKGKAMRPVEYAMEKIFEEGEVDAY